MNTLPVAIRPRLAQFVRLLASDHDGEVVAAVRATGRTLQAAGLSFSELAAEIEHEPAVRIVFRDRPEPHVRQSTTWGSGPAIVKATLERGLRAGVLSEWETGFAQSVIGQMSVSWSWRPSPKQQALVDGLLSKINAAETRA